MVILASPNTLYQSAKVRFVVISTLVSVGIFFARFPIENRNDVASVAPSTAIFSAPFPQISLSVISRDASARDATSSIFNDLQAAGARSNLVGRWGIGKRIGGGRIRADGCPL